MWRKRTTRQEALAGYLFIAPNLIGFLVFQLIPIIAAVVLSFTAWDLINDPKWVGLANYKALLRDPVFKLSLKKTFQFVIINVPLQSALALIIAVLLNQNIRLQNLLRTLFIVPWVSMSVAVGLTWTWIFNSQFGIINQILLKFGMQRIPWLASQDWALPSVIIVNVWQYLGFHIIVFLTGLQLIPREITEAAIVDGASAWTRFWRITIPLIGPILFYDLIVNMIGTFQIFDLPYAMTGGGPGNATRVYNLYLYQKGFQFLRMGEATAMAVILFLLIAVTSGLFFRIIGRRINYDLT
ncbi:MAG: sugar ABC transporter permease [Firmicutes bacterium]|nr:sugar ABC transporter permease [Bacillota bacterium]